MVVNPFKKCSTIVTLNIDTSFVGSGALKEIFLQWAPWAWDHYGHYGSLAHNASF